MITSVVLIIFGMLLSEAAAVSCPNNESIVCTDVFGSLRHARDCHEAMKPNITWVNYCKYDTSCSESQCWCSADVGLCSTVLVLLPLITIIPCIIFCCRKRLSLGSTNYVRIPTHAESQSTAIGSHVDVRDGSPPAEVPFVPSVQLSSEVELG